MLTTSNRKRCPKCLYLRHPNDDAKATPDTCPRCGKVYQKSVRMVETERRERSFRTHRTIEFKYCARCHEPVSVYAAQCPHCETRQVSGRRQYLLALAAALLAMVGLARHHQSPVASSSPWPEISDTLFTRCASLSDDYERARGTAGPGAELTLSLQNQWHAECSRKALRDLAESSRTALPVTPQDWLAWRRS